MDWTSILKAAELFVATGGAVLVCWALTVNRIRVKTHDRFAGSWLAVSWGLAMTAIIGGSLARYHDNGQPTPFIFVAALSVLVGLIAMVKGFNQFKEHESE